MMNNKKRARLLRGFTGDKDWQSQPFNTEFRTCATNGVEMISFPKFKNTYPKRYEKVLRLECNVLKIFYLDFLKIKSKDIPLRSVFKIHNHFFLPERIQSLIYVLEQMNEHKVILISQTKKTKGSVFLIGDVEFTISPCDQYFLKVDEINIIEL